VKPEGSLPHSQVTAIPDQSSPLPHHSTSWRAILILFLYIYVYLRLSSGLLPLYTSPAPIYATCPAHLIFLDLNNQVIFGEGYISSLCSLFHSTVTSSLLGPKYSPRHPIPERPQSVFLPQCTRPSITPKQNKMHNFQFTVWHVIEYAKKPSRINTLKSEFVTLRCTHLTRTEFQIFQKMFSIRYVPQLFRFTVSRLHATRHAQNIVFSRDCRSDLGSTQPPIQWVTPDFLSELTLRLPDLISLAI